KYSAQSTSPSSSDGSIAPPTASCCSCARSIEASQSSAGTICEIVNATTRPRLRSMPSRQSSGTSAPGVDMNVTHGNRTGTSSPLGSPSQTSTSAALRCGSSADRQASRARGALLPMTTETAGSADELCLEEGIDELTFLVIFGFGVDGPHIVRRAVEDVQRGQNRRPHRVILIVVAMEAVAPARLQIVERGETLPDYLDRTLVVRVVHRVRLRDANLHAVDDLLGVEQPDPRKLVLGELDGFPVRHRPDVVVLEAEVLDTEATRSGLNHALAP